MTGNGVMQDLSLIYKTLFYEKNQLTSFTLSNYVVNH